MSFEIPVLDVGYVATSSLSAKQYRGVKLSSGEIVIGSVAGESILGVLQDAPAAGVQGAVRLQGITKAVAGGTIAANDRVATDASGDFIKATGGTYSVGTALESAVDNDVFTLELGRGAGFIPLILVASINCQLVKITATTDEVMTDFTPGLADLVIEKFTAIVTTVASTGGKDADFSLVKNASTNLTGTMTMITTTVTPLGKVFSQAITYDSAALLDADDTLSLSSPEVTAAFSEGQVQFNIYGRAGR